MPCHAISLPIQSCLWKCAKMIMKDFMNKMIKKNKRWFRYVCFLVNQKERNKKKWYKSLYERLRKMFVFMMMIFFRKDEIICTEKKHNCFLNDCIVRVSAGGRYQPLGVWPLINEQCHAHFRDLCPAYNKMSVPPTYLPPKNKFLLKHKRISLNFCGLKKKMWKCLLHGKQSNNSEEKKIMHQNLRCIYEDFFCKPSTHLY